ncbi:MAG: bifunctional 2-C-methyl-D-erythritol 4-phosphate cytidylyltransferase/2-C-methyl-D-erythritol 2,4-cyclodiphosphate synthase [Rhodospirillaceae bacterium]
MTQCFALVLAAGHGSRFGSDIPKQYTLLGGKPILRHALEALIFHPKIDQVRVVIRPEDEKLYKALSRDLPLMSPVMGGATRQDSTKNGLKSFEKAPPQKILIHDGARPFPSERLIKEIVEKLDSFDAVIPGLQVHDALKRISETNLLEETIDRRNIVRAQTPQGFRYRAISRAHDFVEEKLFYDDSEIAKKAGLRVSVVKGDPKNLKITTAEDLIHGSCILGEEIMSFRTGIGFDVHKFGPGDHIVLGGVKIDHNQALIGHSDADVLLHAITDAILGSIAAGDIGTHFPDTDPQWQNVESSIFLKRAGECLSELGGKIINIDATIICERPKINPHRNAIAANISSVLGLNPACVSIKATTTEQLGFTGRSEGIASQAVVSVSLPQNN